MGSKNVKVLIFFLFLIFLGVSYIVLAINLKPRFTYKIESEIMTNQSESPLEIKTEKGMLKFSIKLSAKKSEFDKADLKTNLYISKEPPFVHYANTLTISLSDDHNVVETDREFFTITGDIKNLDQKEYKIRVIDEHSNLLDEKMVKITE